MLRISDEEVVARWRAEVVGRAEEIDEESDKGGHDWHSLWSGFVIALGRTDLASWSKYMEMGFPVEGEG